MLFPWKGRGLVVTGTDTEVGKTWVTGSLAHWMRRQGWDARVHKPVQSGIKGVPPEETDAGMLRLLSGIDAEMTAICPVSLMEPLAPVMAARREKVSLDPRQMISIAENQMTEGTFLLLEGAGGLLAPLADGFDLTDLAKALQLPLLIVARPGLGTVNHTLLTIAVARMHGLEVAGVVLNGATSEHDLSIAENIEMIEHGSGVKVLAVTPRCSDPLTFRERFGEVWNRPYPMQETEDGH